MRALQRWASQKSHSTLQFEDSMASHDMHMLKMGKRFSKIFPFNIYKLNHVSSGINLAMIHFYETFL